MEVPLEIDPVGVVVCVGVRPNSDFAAEAAITVISLDQIQQELFQKAFAITSNSIPGTNN